jgi:hypothetical protein
MQAAEALTLRAQHAARTACVSQADSRQARRSDAAAPSLHRKNGNERELLEHRSKRK